MPTRSRVRRPHPQGREAGRPAGAGANQVRTGHQSQDCQGAQSHCASYAARPRRRGDRIALFVLRCIRSLLAPRVISLRCRISEAIGAKRTCREHRERVRGCAGPTPFYDVSDRAINVLQRTTLECPSGHPANSATRLKPAFSYIPGAWKS